MAVGVAFGIAIGDLLVTWIGSGALQIHSLSRSR